MKTLLYLPIGLLLCLCGACNHNNAAETTEPVSQDTVTTFSHTFSEERDRLRNRISERINKLQAEIDSARLERQAEKHREKWADYDRRIEEREMRRKEFQQRLDNLETQTEAGWQNFKTEVEEFFNRDRGDSLRMIK